jgi:hypothetical protein
MKYRRIAAMCGLALPLVLCSAMTLFAFSGCAILGTSGVLASSDPEVYVFSAKKETTDKDYSFLVTGNIYEQGTLLYAPRIQGWKLWQDRENQPDSLTNRNRAIRISGILESLGLENLGGSIKNPGRKFIDIGTPKLLFAKQQRRYTWSGVVHSDGTENAQIDFTVYAAGLTGKIKLMAVDKASTLNAALEFEYAISDYHTVTIPPPILAAKLILQDSEYGIYAVTATDYQAKYPDFHESELDKAGWSFQPRFDNFDTFLLKPGQKFQIVDGPGTVFAEIFGDTYTLYDACAEMTMTQRKALKESIALFYVFRLLAREYFSKYTAAQGYASF